MFLLATAKLVQFCFLLFINIYDTLTKTTATIFIVVFDGELVV
jgi:hypothetical protein